MELWLKYILSLPKKERESVFETLREIENGELGGLDIKKLSGFRSYYRVRIWSLRIVLRKVSSSYEIVRIWPRWEVYKNLGK